MPRVQGSDVSCFFCLSPRLSATLERLVKFGSCGHPSNCTWTHSILVIPWLLWLDKPVLLLYLSRGSSWTATSSAPRETKWVCTHKQTKKVWGSPTWCTWPACVSNQAWAQSASVWLGKNHLESTQFPQWEIHLVCSTLPLQWTPLSHKCAESKCSYCFVILQQLLHISHQVVYPILTGVCNPIPLDTCSKIHQKPRFKAEFWVLVISLAWRTGQMRNWKVLNSNSLFSLNLRFGFFICDGGSACDKRCMLHIERAPLFKNSMLLML